MALDGYSPEGDDADAGTKKPDDASNPLGFFAKIIAFFVMFSEDPMKALSWLFGGSQSQGGPQTNNNPTQGSGGTDRTNNPASGPTVTADEKAAAEARLKAEMTNTQTKLTQLSQDSRVASFIARDAVLSASLKNVTPNGDIDDPNTIRAIQAVLNNPRLGNSYGLEVNGKLDEPTVKAARDYFTKWPDYAAMIGVDAKFMKDIETHVTPATPAVATQEKHDPPALAADAASEQRWAADVNKLRHVVHQMANDPSITKVLPNLKEFANLSETGEMDYKTMRGMQVILNNTGKYHLELNGRPDAATLAAFKDVFKDNPAYQTENAKNMMADFERHFNGQTLPGTPVAQNGGPDMESLRSEAAGLLTKMAAYVKANVPDGSNPDPLTVAQGVKDKVASIVEGQHPTAAGDSPGVPGGNNSQRAVN